jgi:hypothetical protein
MSKARALQIKRLPKRGQQWVSFRDAESFSFAKNRTHASWDDRFLVVGRYIPRIYALPIHIPGIKEKVYCSLERLRLPKK